MKLVIASLITLSVVGISPANASVTNKSTSVGTNIIVSHVSGSAGMGR